MVSIRNWSGYVNIRQNKLQDNMGHFIKIVNFKEDKTKGKYRQSHPKWRFLIPF